MSGVALLAKSSDGSTWAREHVPGLNMAVHAEGPDGLRNADLFVRDGIFELWERGTAPAAYDVLPLPPSPWVRLASRVANWLRKLADSVERR